MAFSTPVSPPVESIGIFTERLAADGRTAASSAGASFVGVATCPGATGSAGEGADSGMTILRTLIVDENKKNGIRLTF